MSGESSPVISGPGREPGGAAPEGESHAPSEPRVREMFDDLAGRYDLLNDVLSLGLDRWWRRVAATTVDARPDDVVLDLGCGSGRLGALVARRARVVGVDTSHGMLVAASRRQGSAAGLVQASAFRLPFPDQTFTAAVSGFVLRNLADIPGALAELARVLEPGSMVSLIDITEPPNPVVRRGFDAYFSAIAPALGKLIGKEGSYRYLVRSLAHLPSNLELCGMLAGAGFSRCRVRPLTGGMVTLFTTKRD